MVPLMVGIVLCHLGPLFSLHSEVGYRFAYCEEI